jgi:putative hemolysin
LIFIARPFLVALEGSNTLVLQFLGVKPQSEEQVTQEEIRRVLSAGLSAGALLSFERSMMERVLDLDHRSVRTVMTGQKYIDLLAPDLNENKLREAVLGSAASRLLVAEEGNLDKLVGIVSRADMLARLAQGANVDLLGIAVPAAYVSDNASVLSVLETLKSREATATVCGLCLLRATVVSLLRFVLIFRKAHETMMRVGPSAKSALALPCRDLPLALLEQCEVKDNCLCG